VGKKARLRVNLEQAPAFRPGSRKVHFVLSSKFYNKIFQFNRQRQRENELFSRKVGEVSGLPTLIAQ
jgi:hypothetical protein